MPTIVPLGPAPEQAAPPLEPAFPLEPIFHYLPTVCPQCGQPLEDVFERFGHFLECSAECGFTFSVTNSHKAHAHKSHSDNGGAC